MRDRASSTQSTCVHPYYTSGLYLCGMKAMQHHATAAPGKQAWLPPVWPCPEQCICSTAARRAQLLSSMNSANPRTSYAHQQQCTAMTLRPMKQPPCTSLQ